MANNIANQTKNAQVNSFTGGINTDLHPMLQPNNTLTDCVNGTLITYDGNENMLQNDMGNYALKGAKLPVNYVPIGLKEYGGILYIVAYNPTNKHVQIGSYPSPKVNFDASESGAEISVSQFPIKVLESEDLNMFELLKNPKLESGPEYHLYSNLISKANQFMSLLGTMNQTHYQLTIRDQYKLIITSDENNTEWLQKLCFFSVDESGILLDVTDKIVKDSEDNDLFHNVLWDAAGWIGVKYELATVSKCSQVITGVKYPTCDRSFKNKESMPEADINPKVVSADDESDSSFDQEDIIPPRPRPSLKDVIANGSWADKFGSMFNKSFTGDTLSFTVNASMRLPENIWKEYIDSEKLLGWNLILNGEGKDKASYQFSVKNEDTTMQVKKSGDFYNVDCKYVFNNPIPDDFVKINIESVFYCKNESTGQLLVLDQTYQEDVILIPNRFELDYGDVKVLEFKYEVQLESGTETSKNYTHNVLADVIFNTEIDSQHLNFKLTDLSGKYTITTSSGSGTTESHTVGFSKLSENIQFARMDITLTDPNTLELKSIFSEIIMINTIINNYDRTNMATLPWNKIIDKIIVAENNEWKIKINYDNLSDLTFKHCRYELVDNKIVNWIEEPIPKDIIPVVNIDGRITGYENVIISDTCYAPTNINITLGNGIKISGCSKSISVHYGDMVRTFGTKADQTYIIGGDSRSQDMFPIALCDIQLTPNESVPVNGFPTKERMLKYLYRPINFDSFMKDLGFSEEDINKLDDYWEEGRSNGVIGHLDADLKFEVLNTKDFNSNTPYREILPNLRDRLPVIFPVKILNHNQNHGMLTPFLTTFDERKEYVKTVINKKGKRAEYSDEEKKWWPAYRSSMKTSFPHQVGLEVIPNDHDIERVSTVITKHSDMYTFGVLGHDENKQFWTLVPWFSGVSLYDKDHFKKVEKFILWLGLGLSRASFNQVNTAHDVYLSNKPEVNVKTCTKIECDITNTVFEYCSLTDAISNIHICAESENSEQEIDTTMCPTLTNLNNSLDFYTHQLTPQDNNNHALSEFAEMTGWTKSESEPVSVSVSYNWFPGNPEDAWSANDYYKPFPLFYCQDKSGSGDDVIYYVNTDRVHYSVDWGRGFNMCKVLRPYKPSPDNCHTWNDAWYKYETITNFVTNAKDENCATFNNKFVVWPPNMKTIFNQAFDQSLFTNPQIDSDIKKWMVELLDEYEYVKNHKSKN